MTAYNSLNDIRWRITQPEYHLANLQFAHSSLYRLSRLLLIDIDVLCKEYRLLFKHISNYHMPIWSPSELFDFKKIYLMAKLTRRDIALIDLLKTILIGVKVCPELFDEAIIILLLEKIHKKLDTNYVSIIPSFFQIWLGKKTTWASYCFQGIIGFSNVFCGDC